MTPLVLEIKSENKQISEEVTYLESKLNNLEGNLPIIIKEILDVHLSQKSMQDSQKFATKEELSKLSKRKVDCDVFNSFQKG